MHVKETKLNEKNFFDGYDDAEILDSTKKN